MMGARVQSPIALIIWSMVRDGSAQPASPTILAGTPATVTLCGTGKENEDRHPKIRRGVLIGAGAKILGNIEIGHCARIAAGSVVVKPVPHNVTVAGVPAKIVGEAGCAEPSRTMDQMINAIGI